MKTWLALAAVGLGLLGCEERPVRHALAAEAPEIATRVLICIKVDRVRPNGFTGEPEYLAIWMLHDDGTIEIFTCPPSSSNYAKLKTMQAYRQYKIRTKTEGHENKCLSLDDLGDVGPKVGD